MIDLLLQVFGPSLAQKLFASHQGEEKQITLQDVAEALVEVGADTSKHKEAIAAIQHELQGLSPQNVNPQLEAIYKWMQEHVDYEEQQRRLAQEQQSRLARQRLYWRIGLATGVVVAITLAVICLLR